MRAIGQITITNICDVVASDTPPENPYVGQLWVDTSVSPPETKIWNGAEWVVQNDIETLRVTISVLTTRAAELQSTIDGLNSYVGTMTQTIETITGSPTASATSSRRSLRCRRRCRFFSRPSTG